MSYKIVFWKPKPGTTTPPRAIYERGSPETLSGELETLPLDPVLDALKEAFPGFDPADDPPLVELSETGDGDGSMEVFPGPQWFRFVFRGPDTGAAMAKVWRVMSGFGCVCYDPQTDALYTPERPPNYHDPTPEQKRLEVEYGGRDTASLKRRAQERATRWTIVGCAAMLAVGVLFGGAVVAVISYLLT